MLKLQIPFAFAAAALLALGTSARAQTPTPPRTLLPGDSIEVEFHFEPFSLAPRAPSFGGRGMVYIVEPQATLSCPMPVVVGDESNDMMGKHSEPSRDSDKSPSMPTTIPGCRNPLGPQRAPGSTLLVY